MKNCISLYNVDIICINETHLNSSIKDAEIYIQGFSHFRNDRDFKIEHDNSKEISGGGGSIIYVHENVKCSKLDSFDVPDSVSVEIATNVGLVNIACIYRSKSLSDSQLNSMNVHLEKLAKVNEETLVVGDFNLTDVNWITGSVVAPSVTTNKSLVSQMKFMDTIHQCGYTWYITDEVTRRRMVNGILQESTLDQILSTSDAAVTDFNVVSKLGKSDHLCILVELNMSNEISSLEQQTLVPAWSKVPVEQLLESASNIDWNFQSENLSSEDMWNELVSKISTVTQSVPLKRKNAKPWGSSMLKRYRRAKDKAWSDFDSDPSTENFSIAHEADSKYAKVEWSSMTKYEHKITSLLKENCKPFYAYLRSKRILKTRVGCLSKPDGSTTQNETETAEVLADAFSSVFVDEPEGPLQQECYHSSENVDEIEDIDISLSEVAEELKKIDVNKSQGPDSIHPKLLKSLAGNMDFVAALTELFNVCASTGNIPLAWKEANVVGLYKKGSKKDALNYRPVSLTSIVCKVYEKFLHRHILQHIENKISSCQHGFVQGKSCFSNLLESVEKMLTIVEEGFPVDIFYMDFWKAFDTVPHFRLLTKMESMGITGKTLNIIRDFLSGRTLRVCVGQGTSRIRFVLSGVPQGSVLGPLLFIIFINDLPNFLNGTPKLFADDLKLIVDASKTEDIDADLKSLERWEQLWLLKFNIEKCKVLHLEFNENPNNQYTFNNIALVKTGEKDKDLGIFPDANLLWTDQIRNSVSKAVSMIAWITRTVISRERNLMLHVYKATIRPHLEYCVQIWSPVARHGNSGLILELESIQRRFTRLVDGIGLLPYSERLKRLYLTTLAERRIRGDLIETFKIVNGIVSYGQSLFNRSRSGLNLINKSLLNIDSKIKKCVDSFLPNRVIQYWNLLPNYVKQSADVNSFKANLENYKMENMDTIDTGNFWEISHHVLNKIECVNYLINRSTQSSY